MRTLFRLSFCGVLMISLTATASAQFDAAGFDLDQPLIQRFQTPVGQLGIGQVWFGGNAANHGLGYEGSYASAGTVLELGEDALDGFWNFDARGHISERGRVFTNIGLMRGMFLVPANTELRGSIWFDYDDDQAKVFGHSFSQVAFGAALLNELFEVHFNGYVPVKTTDFESSGFVGNNFLVQNGIDSALRGVDLKVAVRPAVLQHWATLVELGTYYYESDLVNGFTGFSAGFSVQPVHSMNVNFQVNVDDQFDTTGFLGLSFHFGGAHGRGITPGHRDPELTRRNDHIVRVHRDSIIATNPLTGRPWEVIHVDNTNPSAIGGRGTAENPFTTLAAAQTASTPDQIILVREGDGTTRGMDMGIVLQDRQLFLGDGVAHFVPTVERGSFLLPNDQDGIRPTITNSAGGDVVVLADNNTVSGFIIDGMGVASNAVQGIGITGAEISDNLISNMTMHGISLTGAVAGNVNISSNTMDTLGLDGIHVESAFAEITVSGNEITGAMDDAMEFLESTGTLVFDSNVISDIVDDGISIDSLAGRSDGTFTFTNNVVSETGGDAIMVRNHLTLSMSIADNQLTQTGIISNNGIFLQNVSTRLGENIAITGNTITGYGNALGEAGINIDVNEIGLPGGIVPTGAVTSVVMSGNTIDMNETGIIAQIRGDAVAGAPNLNTMIISNASISNNRRDGIQVRAFSGANHVTEIRDNRFVNQNGVSGGAGLQVVADSSTLSANIVRNRFASNQGLTAPAIPPGGVPTSGILGNIAGPSDVNITISDNLVDGTDIVGMPNVGQDTGIGFNFTSSFDSPSGPALITLTRNIIQNHDDNGASFNIDGTAGGRVDILAQTNTITNNGLDGFQVNTFGTGGVVARAVLSSSNNIFANRGNGIGLNAAGASRLLAQIQDNIVPGGGGITNNVGAGIGATTTDNAVMVADVTNNTITNNTEEGILALLTPGAVPMAPQMFVFIQQNTISGNDSFDIPPATPEGPADVFAHIDPGLTLGQLCVSLTNNNVPSAFPAVVNPYQAFNESVPNQLRFENDGTNGAPTFVLLPPNRPTGMPVITTPVIAGPGSCADGAVPFRVFP